MAPELQGILSVLCTPFHEDGSIDEASLVRLVEHNLAWGVDAIVCFGLAGEIYKLTDLDRHKILAAVVHAVDGAVPVIAGTEHTGTEGAVARSRGAQEAGAAAVMVYPPTFVKPNRDQVIEYYQAISEAIEIPIVIQDAPAWTGVPLPVELLITVARHAPQVRYVKVEAPPTSPKIAALNEAQILPLGGYGALHLAEELTHGIRGTMPACAYPGFFKELWRAHEAGDRDTVWSLFTRILPLTSFQMGSLDLLVAVQKILLSRIGVLSSARLRRPAVSINQAQLEWLDLLLERTGIGPYLKQRP